ncbi:putative uncharacterized protein DDB_G0290521 [Neodiprion pinetum]|uniref:putative uncharacterized protein DDB_G0290521 n=1 Tax=Neodiprion pinetum TaxID=441929 RepID=UPI00372016F9
MAFLDQFSHYFFQSSLRRELNPTQCLRNQLENDDEIELQDTDRWTDHLRRLQTLRDEVQRHLIEANEKQAHYYNLRRRDIQFKEGDRVLKKNHTLSSGPERTAAKLSEKFTGPYIITKKISPTIYELTTESERQHGKHTTKNTGPDDTATDETDDNKYKHRENTTTTNTRTGPTPTQIRTRRHTPDRDPTNSTTDAHHTHTVTLSGPRQCPKCNGLVRDTKYPQHVQTCTQTNTDTQHPAQIVTHPPTVTQTTRTTATHTTTHPPTKKQTPHTTTHPTSTPTPRHTPPPASPALWTRTRLTRPQTTEDRILQTFANMDTRTEPTQTRQTYKKHIGPPLEIISIIANLQATNTLDDELRAQRDRYMTRRAHQHTNADETEASTSTHQPHTTHQTAPPKTQPSNTPDTDTDTDSTTSTAETVIHIETTHTTTPQTQTTDDDTDNNTDTTSLTGTDEHTQTPQPITHTTRDSRRYKKRKTIHGGQGNRTQSPTLTQNHGEATTSHKEQGTTQKLTKTHTDESHRTKTKN